MTKKACKLSVNPYISIVNLLWTNIQAQSQTKTSSSLVPRIFWMGYTSSCHARTAMCLTLRDSAITYTLIRCLLIVSRVSYAVSYKAYTYCLCLQSC